MARVLCINPWIYDFAAYNMWIEPLGLLTVAGVLRAAGHDVALLDCLDRRHPAAPAPQSERDAHGCGRFAKTEVPKPKALAHVPRHWGRYGLPTDLFEAELDAQPRPDAVLVTSMMTYWYPGPFEAIRRVKARWPDVPLALGGVYATLCADHARAGSGADAVLTGPGEVKALQWMNDVTGEACAPAAPVHEILPAHDLRRPQGYVAVQTARGCPFHCPYCAVHQLSPRGFAPRPPRQVVAEIAWCVEALGAHDVAFYDDALLTDADRHLHPILDDVIERGLRVRFHTPNGLHARFIDQPLARKMRQAGFETIRLGLETADPGDQRRDGGKIDDTRFALAVQALFDAGFSAREVAAYVLIGRPGQSVEKVRATVAFAHQLGVQVRTAQFSPIPGTAEWRVAVAQGCLAADADPLLHNNSIYPCADSQAWEATKQQIRDGNHALLTVF
ncbi:MAG: radical SAM protein [Anaerolineae bacterium]|nr:MAG: radical SAM protein [Anaerolineae bacterium]